MSENTAHPDEQRKKQRHQHDTQSAAVLGAITDTVNRYGNGVKEFSVGYTGKDHSSGQVLSKGLKTVSESNVNPGFAEQNVKQQAGFSAEIATTARENAQAVIDGKTSSHITRTDDMTRQSDGKGHTIGGTNEQLYDIAAVTGDGGYIDGTGRQLKYVGGNAQQCHQKLISQKFDKYFDNEVPVEIPADYYDDVAARFESSISRTKEQIQHAEKCGNTSLAEQKRRELERLQRRKDGLRKGKLTSKEALEARTNPLRFIAKDIAKVSHHAGVEAAKYGALVGGSVSIVQNVVAVIRDEKTPEDAICDVEKDTAVAAAKGYGTGFAGSAVKGLMQNARSETLRNLAGTGLPVALVTLTISVGDTMHRYFSGEIDGVKCLEDLGAQGTGMFSSALWATIGQAAIPIPVVGGLIGGMVGYAVASASYSELVNALKDAKLAAETRVRIEQECEQQIKLIEAYRAEIEAVIHEYLAASMQEFKDAFDGIQGALNVGDANGVIASANRITESLGKNVPIKNMDGLCPFLENGGTFRF